MRNPTIILSMGIGVWLLGIGADARPSNPTLTGHLLPEDHFTAKTMMNGSTNYGENKERLPLGGIDETIASLIELMTPANKAIPRIAEFNPNKLDTLKEMDTYVKYYNKCYLATRSTLYDAYLTHFDDPKEFSNFIEAAKNNPATQDIGERLKWLRNGKIPSEVLTELKLVDDEIPVIDKLPKLQRFIEDYNIVNTGKKTNLYRTMESCFEKGDLTEIVDEELKKMDKAKPVARQLKWWIAKEDPKKLFKNLQSLSLKKYFSTHFRDQVQRAVSVSSNAELSQEQRTDFKTLFVKCWVAETNPEASPITELIETFLKKDWVIHNDDVTKFVTEELNEAQYSYFKSDDMNDWIAYADAYIKDPMHLKTNQETYLLDLSTFTEDDVVKMVFRTDNVYNGRNEPRWINDLQLRWSDKDILPIKVFSKLVNKKDYSHFVDTSQFLVWLYYVKYFGATHPNVPQVSIVKTLEELVGLDSLVEAINEARKDTRIGILEHDVRLQVMYYQGDNTKVNEVKKLKEIQKALEDAKRKALEDVKLRSRKD